MRRRSSAAGAIAGSRLCSTEQLFILAVVVIPVDLAAGAIALTPGRRVLPLALAAGVAVIYVGTRQLGIFTDTLL